MKTIPDSIAALAVTNSAAQGMAFRMNEGTPAKNLRALILATAVAMTFTTAALAGGYERIEAIIPIGPPNEVVNLLGEDGTMMADEDLLFNKTVCPGQGLHDAFGPELNPVLAPDGHQISWGEYNQARGRVLLRCGPKGTHVVMHLSGLIPKGVYTIWVFTFAEGVTGPIGAGALGAPDGSHSAFVASASGEGNIVVHHPAGSLSVNGSVGSCLLDEYEFHLVGAYHSDGEVYGPTPAPIPASMGGACYWVPHFAFIVEP
jgi:hypothetical protein